MTVAHTYSVSGQYTIRLTITDAQGQQASIAQTVWVLEESDFPEAGFTASPSSGGTPLTVAFNAAASADPNGIISTYLWSFGDGSTGSGVPVVHTYATQGSYMALLTVTDNEGFSDSMSMLIVVIDGGQGAAVELQLCQEPIGATVRWTLFDVSLGSAASCLRQAQRELVAMVDGSS